MLHGRNRPFARSRGVQGQGAAFFAAVTAAGGSVSAGRQTLYNNLFASLASAGLTAKIQRLGIMAAENSASARVDLMDPTKLLTFTGAPTFTANQGVVSIDASNYVNTGFTAPSALFVQDSAFHMVGTLGTRAVGADTAILGNIDGAGGSLLWPWAVSGATNCGTNMATTFNTNYTHPAATIKGLYVNTRRSVAGQENYFNGASVNTSSQTSAAPAVQPFLIGCWRNNISTITAFDGSLVPCWAVGGQLSTAEVQALTTAINTYMTAIGSPLF